LLCGEFSTVKHAGSGDADDAMVPPGVLDHLR
jgi:hypothetical protein